MGQQIAGPGVLLPPPQNYYPSELYNAPQDPSSNVMALAAGDVFNVPAGNYYLDTGGLCVVQYLDPVNSLWTIPESGPLGGIEFIKSDGYNCRIANLTGCPVAAVVTNAGSNYVQGTTTVTAGTGNSTWQAIVGGQVSITSVTVAGSGYGVAPLLMIPPPPSPGIQAYGHTVITGGSVTSVVLDSIGAGYTSAPTPVIVPSPFDPNLNSSITQAACTTALVGSGTISAVLCTNNGAPVASAPSLTISGAGSSAAATAVLMQTVTGASVYGAGSGYTGGAVLTTVGGVPTATAVNKVPLAEGRDFIPRPAQALLAVPVGSSIASVSTIYDGGLFLGTPNTVVSPVDGALITASASVVAILGSGTGTIRLQPAP